MKTSVLIFSIVIFLFYSCGETKEEKKELSGPHAAIVLQIANPFSSGLYNDAGSSDTANLQKRDSKNDFYTALLQSDTLIRKTLLKLGMKPTDERVSSIRENMSFENLNEESNLLQIELYYEEEKFSCTFLDELVKAFEEELLTEIHESSQQKIQAITDQIDSVAAKLHEIEELMMGNQEILSLERESDEYFDEYIKLEKKRTLLKKLKDCLSRDYSVCLGEAQYYFVGEDDFLSATVNKLYALNLKKSSIQCPTAGNEQCKKLDKEITELLSNLDTYLKNTLLAIDELLNQYEENIKKLPRTEREISREFDINQKLYMFLLEKKAELTISRAGIFSPIKLIDRARWVVK